MLKQLQYRMYGEAVVRACLETKSHHLDISGEPGVCNLLNLFENSGVISEAYIDYYSSLTSKDHITIQIQI